MRLAFMTLYLSAFMLFSCYSAAFISDLTMQDPALPFTSFEELLKDGSYMLAMVPISAQMDYFRVSYIIVLHMMKYV
jgi:hypothetical protein